MQHTDLPDVTDAEYLEQAVLGEHRTQAPARQAPRKPHGIEAVLGVRTMDEIEADLDVMLDEWSRGWALYGPGGTWSDMRKAKLSARELAIRDGWNEIKQGKMTDAKLDAEAHADPEYRRWLDNSNLERAQWIILDQARWIVKARKARDDGLIYAAPKAG